MERPKLKFGKGKGPKITLASQEEIATYAVEDSQAGDILAITRRPIIPPYVDPEQKPKPKPTVKPMFEAEKAKTVKPVSIKEETSFLLPVSSEQKEASTTKEESDIDLTKYDDTMMDYAVDIIASEYDNPYKNQSERPAYPLQTRLGFQQQILKVFSDFIHIPEFGKEPDYDACKKLSQRASSEVEMYEYQKFVREYIRQATPYRGMLVYHGLGSGKTCSAIAAAEALFSVSRKKIIVMTPASLRDNFIREITFCGFKHFRLQNFWVKLDPENPLTPVFAAEILNLPPAYIKKNKDFWVPDFSQEEPNFNSLSDQVRQQITQQVATQINERITFINYNGITASKLKEIACAPPDENGDGFFDNKVIVIDEIHNLTRLMQGTIEPYLSNLPGMKRKVPYEPIAPGKWDPALCKVATDPRRPALTNYKRGYLLYRLLATAKNSKLIGLSGTPLINFPEEISILMNLLGGYIHSCSFSLSSTQKGLSSEKLLKEIRSILLDQPTIDFEQVELQGLNIHTFFSVLPEGMVKVEGGAQRLPPGQKTKSIQEVTSEVLSLLSSKGFKVVKQPEYKSYPLLPPVGEEFREAFLSKDGSTLKNKIVLMKRIQGLVSYYRGSKKELMPAVTKDELVRCPLSPYAQAEYQRVRGEELSIQIEKESKKKGASSQLSGMSSKMANLWATFYEISTMKQSNSYRMSSRQACNFAFPEGITRPRAGNLMDAVAEIGEEKEILDSAPVEAERPGEIILQSEALLADEKAAEEEDKAIDEAVRKSKSEDAKAEGNSEEAEAIEEEGEPDLIKELKPVESEGDLVPAAAPSAAVATSSEGAVKKTLSAANRLKIEREKEQEKCKKGQLPGEDYSVALRRSKKCLENFAFPRLRLYPPGKKISDEIRAGTPPDPSRLAKYSPKYARILQNVLEAPGSSLVYSQFLDMEGIGIFLVCLKINDFQPIVIEADGEGGYRFSPSTLKHLEKGPSVNRFLSFTGGEERGIRSTALKVFNAKFSNGKFTELSPEMSDALVKAGFTGNLKGELCRVFCITSAGAEGLSLRNVRRVHIMEPFWNHVRTDQVKGRAVRICSHVDLDLEDRNVEVFTYCSVFDKEALLHPAGTAEGGFPRIDQTILNGDGMKADEAVKMGYDVPPGVKEYVVTSDEYLYTISQKKKELLENIQNLMKQSAIDCTINREDNKEDGLACIKLPGTTEQYAFHPDLIKDLAQTSFALQEGSVEEPVLEKEERPSTDSESGSESAQAGEPGFKPFVKEKKAPPTQKAKVVKIAAVPYLAVPVLEKASQAVLSYDLYARGDVYRIKKIGTMVADSEGNPTSDYTLF